MAPVNCQLDEQGGSFLSLNPSDVFAPEDFPSDERLMVEMAEQFSRKEVQPVAERLERQEDGLMPGLIRKAGELGFCGVDCPEGYGGLGLGKNISARILEHLSLNGSFSVTIGVTSGIAQFGLAAFGRDDQKAKYLPQLATGEWIGAYALSEPNSGTDALAMSAKAELKGGKWILDGTKMWISNAKWAEMFLVMAKVNGSDVTAFLVEKDFPGVTVAREEHKMGLKGSSTARVVLDSAEVPEENVLHEVGKGHHVAFNALNIGRFKLGAMSLGPAREAIKVSAAYAKERRQFGQAISEFGLIRKKFADMAALFYAAESCLYRTGAAVDGAFARMGGSVDGNRSAAEEFAVECSISKILATEAEAVIVDEAFQVFGGYGFTEEFPIAAIYRDARVSRIYEGTNEINRVAIADRIRRRVADGRLAPAPDPASFVAELAIKATGLVPAEAHQEALGAFADILVLAYAEQSVRLRAARQGGVHRLAANRFTAWANLQAARAFQVLQPSAVALPAPDASGTDELAAAILSKEGPV